jgi:hypothetical protein
LPAASVGAPLSAPQSVVSKHYLVPWLLHKQYFQFVQFQLHHYQLFLLQLLSYVLDECFQVLLGQCFEQLQYFQLQFQILNQLYYQRFLRWKLNFSTSSTIICFWTSTFSFGLALLSVIATGFAPLSAPPPATTP